MLSPFATRCVSTSSLQNVREPLTSRDNTRAVGIDVEHKAGPICEVKCDFRLNRALAVAALASESRFAMPGANGRSCAAASLSVAIRAVETDATSGTPARPRPCRSVHLRRRSTSAPAAVRVAVAGSSSELQRHL